MYKHPGLYQKQNEYGLGTYTKSFIPSGTIILKERPHNLTHITKDDPTYIFQLIKHLLATRKKEFLSMVPESVEKGEDYNNIRYYHETFLPELSEDEMKVYYTKYKRNAFKFGVNPGFLFYGTRLNHSCDPNVKYSPCDKNIQMVFETTRDIEPNEEVFDSYINYNEPKTIRQRELLRRYGFTCGCKKCLDET